MSNIHWDTAISMPLALQHYLISWAGLAANLEIIATAKPIGSNSFGNVGWLRKEPFCFLIYIFAGVRVLGDGLRALADGVLSELAGQQQTDGGLDLAARDRRPLVVVCTGRVGKIRQQCARRYH